MWRPTIIWDQTSCCQILSKPIESYQSRPGKVFCFSALHSHSLWLFSIISPPLWQKHDHWKGKCISSAWSDRVACVCTARWIIAAWNGIICLKQGTGSRRICKDWKHTALERAVELDYSSAVGLTSLRGSLSSQWGSLPRPVSQKASGCSILGNTEERCYFQQKAKSIFFLWIQLSYGKHWGASSAEELIHWSSQKVCSLCVKLFKSDLWLIEIQNCSYCKRTRAWIIGLQRREEMQGLQCTSQLHKCATCAASKREREGERW